MKAVLQRALRGSVSVGGIKVGEIGAGLVVLLGVGQGDTLEKAAYLAEKTAHLRIFPDDQGKLNLSLLEKGGEILVVSQFTLYADCNKGRRPSFQQAAEPALANSLYEAYVASLRDMGLKVETGIFQSDMAVEIINDGPVTLILER